jgi:hypothetical protein
MLPASSSLPSGYILIHLADGCRYFQLMRGVQAGAKFTAIELDAIPEGKAVRAELAEVSNGQISSHFV